MTSTFVLSFTHPAASLENVGGKGANLARLAQAGFPVPGGFLLTTAAYRAYVGANGLQAEIAASLHGLDAQQPAALEAASSAIRAAFNRGQMPGGLAEEIERAYAALESTAGSPPVAVRSSATAEDLPDMSFAGQQDTYLNIIGSAALQQAVVDCWSSLWTARAIGYRARNAIDHSQVSLSVVVQHMVQSEASGVLFTANPLSGLRSQTVIDATLGLGEALVSGQVEPDHYVVDSASRRIVEKTLGAKALVIRGQAQGGLQHEKAQAGEVQALPDEQILALTDLGQQAAALYAFPQDIEWGWADGRLYLLQSRPITSLYPIPKGLPQDSLQVTLSFAAVQGLVDPMTPLGLDTIRMIMAGGSALFGVDVTYQTQRLAYEAGERLWLNITPAVRNRLGGKLVLRILPMAEPGSVETMRQLLKDPRLQGGLPRLRNVRSLLSLGHRLFNQMRHYWHDPQNNPQRIQEDADQRVAELRIQATARNGSGRLSDSLKLHDEAYGLFPYAIPKMFPAAMAGILPIVILERLTRRLPGCENLYLEVTRGLPHNVTTEMDLFLWQTACRVRADAASLERLQLINPPELAQAYRRGELPPVAQQAVDSFLQRYGLRGLCEIDFGHPRWREEPVQVFQMLQNYLRVEDPEQAPDAVFRRGAQAAEAAIEKMATAARSTFGGRIKERLVRWAAVRVRAFAGLRESPKLHIIQIMDIIRQALLENGAELAAAGILQRPDDLFYLRRAELDQLALEVQDGPDGVDKGRWQALVAGRRADYEREMRRRQLPRLLLSDGRAFYEGMGAGDQQEGELRGSPVSPGIVEGVVRVVFDPSEAHLEPGEILVCPATDPAWTPLFLSAGGLVMEVGGMMTQVRW